jgi:hypothetical protein
VSTERKIIGYTDVAEDRWFLNDEGKLALEQEPGTGQRSKHYHRFEVVHANWGPLTPFFEEVPVEPKREITGYRVETRDNEDTDFWAYWDDFKTEEGARARVTLLTLEEGVEPSLVRVVRRVNEVI